MLDLTGELKNNDLDIKDANIYRAKNLLEIQLGELEYLKDWGIDIKFWFDEKLIFQNESFIAYLESELVKKRVYCCGNKRSIARLS